MTDPTPRRPAAAHTVRDLVIALVLPLSLLAGASYLAYAFYLT